MRFTPCMTAIAFFLFVFSACSSKTTEKKRTAAPSQEACILITNTKGLDNKGKKTATLNYSDYFGNINTLLKDAVDDTAIAVPVSCGVINATRGINNYTSFYSLPGDTIVITFSPDTILVKSKHYPFVSYRDFYLFSKKKNESDFNKIDSLTNSILFKRTVSGSWYSLVRKKQVPESTYENVKNYILNLNKQLLQKEMLQLDSLVNAEACYAQYRNWIEILLKMDKINLSNTITSFTAAPFMKPNYDAYDFISDSSSKKYIPEYRYIISTNFLTDVILKRNRIKLPTNQFTYDYKEAFDSAEAYLSGPLLDFVRFHCISRIKEQNTNATFEEYKNKFYKSVRDTLFHNYVSNNLDNTAAAGKWKGKGDLFKDYNGNVLTFDEIYKKQKTAYIDFWASWCGPCREEIPFSLQLRDRYSKSNIDFIYISVDEDFLKWKNAVDQLNMQKITRNYLLLNQKESSLVNGYKINMLPRYMIFNNKGNVIYKEAPAPSSSETIRIIDELLNN